MRDCGDRGGIQLDVFVSFPTDDFDVKKYYRGNSPHTKYELFAVSNHFGSIGGGHYTAYAKVESPAGPFSISLFI